MRKRKNRKMIPIIRIIVVISCLGIASTIFALFYAVNSNIIGNVKIENIKVSGLSRTEVEKKFESILDSILEDETILKYGEYEQTFTLKRMELQTDVNDKVYEACTLGRNNNIIANNYKIISTLINGENLELNVKFNEEILDSIFNNLDAEWEEAFTDNSYYVNDNKLVIVRGKTGVVIDKEALREKLIELVHSKIEGQKINEIEIPIITKEPGEIDIEKIKNEVYKEPKNASYDKSKSKLTVHSNGIELAVSIDEAKEVLKNRQEEYELPLKITKPEITTDMLGEDAFPDVLGSFSTRYDASNKNRATNIELAAEAINGKILMPGEVFSFNGIVGNTTPAKGYKLAGAYSAGELVENYGGGVCQVSSTIYNVALYANLGIVERYNHSAVVSYVDPGRDATISYGSRDFKFKNNREYAIKLNARGTNGILEIEIRGIFEKEEYEIEIIGQKTETIPCNVKYKYDSNLLERTRNCRNNWCKRGKKYCLYST